MSQHSLLKRIAKLEDTLGKFADRIPIYVEDEKDLAARVDELIAIGRLAAADRPRCAFWLDCRPYIHWQRNDEITRRLQAQAAIVTPCAKWLAQPAAPEHTPES